VTAIGQKLTFTVDRNFCNRFNRTCSARAWPANSGTRDEAYAKTLLKKMSDYRSAQKSLSFNHDTILDGREQRSAATNAKKIDLKNLPNAEDLPSNFENNQGKKGNGFISAKINPSPFRTPPFPKPFRTSGRFRPIAT
jgi:hypothetical protein